MYFVLTALVTESISRTYKSCSCLTPTKNNERIVIKATSSLAKMKGN